MVKNKKQVSKQILECAFFLYICSIPISVYKNIYDTKGKKEAYKFMRKFTNGSVNFPRDLIEI